MVEEDRILVLKNNLTTSTFTLTIQDDDIIAPIFDIFGATFTENTGNFGGGTAPFTNKDSNTLDFHFKINDSSTASSSDYIIDTTSQTVGEVTTPVSVPDSVELDLDNGTGIIRNVVSNEKRRLLFQPIDDTEVEEIETVIITLTHATDIDGKFFDFEDISYTTFITDNDTVNSVSYFGFESASSNVLEGDEGTTTSTVRIVADQVQTQDRELIILINSSSTAVNGEDFLRDVSTSNQAYITMASGTDYADLDISILGDTTYEPGETIVLTAGSTNYDDFKVDTNSSTYIMTIQNDDTDNSGGESTPTVLADVSFETSTSTVDENSVVTMPTLMNNGLSDVMVKFTMTGSAVDSGAFYFQDDGNGSYIAPLFGSRDSFAWVVPHNTSTSLPLVINSVDSDQTLVLTLGEVSIFDEAGANVVATTTDYTNGNITTHTLTIKNVTPTSENNIPTVKTPIVTQLIDLHVSSTVIIDKATLQNLFSDLDTSDRVGISLTNNTDATVVTTTSDLEFSSLELTGLKVGTSTIELTGDDHRGGIVTSTFDIIVTDSTPVEENTNPPANNTSGGGGSSLLPNTAPQAAVTNGQEVTVEVNKEITFDASGSVDKEGNIRFYFWNFGDGSDEVYFTFPTVKHTYTKIGTHTLTIKVKDAYGAESSAEVKVKVVAGKASTNTGTPDKTSNTKTETTTPTSTTDTATPVEETGSTGTTNNNNNNNTSANNTEEEATTTEEENTSTEEETTSENTEEGITEEVPAETTEELPTWIKIIFGSGALAAVAGAGLAINKVRKSV
ncbi:MAG: PKD domain-containing protein [Patescibacteria group bacterium]|nr:PKD domain-containing protein [Patescibacteria group bacterium]